MIDYIKNKIVFKLSTIVIRPTVSIPAFFDVRTNAWFSSTVYYTRQMKKIRVQWIRTRRVCLVTETELAGRSIFFRSSNSHGQIKQRWDKGPWMTFMHWVKTHLTKLSWLAPLIERNYHENGCLWYRTMNKLSLTSAMNIHSRIWSLIIEICVAHHWQHQPGHHFLLLSSQIWKCFINVNDWSNYLTFNFQCCQFTMIYFTSPRDRLPRQIAGILLHFTMLGGTT